MHDECEVVYCFVYSITVSYLQLYIHLCDMFMWSGAGPYMAVFLFALVVVVVGTKFLFLCHCSFVASDTKRTNSMIKLRSHICDQASLSL